MTVPKRTTIAIPIAAIAVTLIALAGCSATAMPLVATSKSNSFVSGAGIRLDQRTQQIFLPLDAYYASGAQLGEIIQANNLSISKCMDKRGLPYPVGDIDLRRSPLRPNWSLGIWSKQWAERYGYFVPQDAKVNAALNDPRTTTDKFAMAFDICANSPDLLPVIGANYIDPDAIAVKGVADEGVASSLRLARMDGVWNDTREKWWRCLRAHGVEPRTSLTAWTPEIPTGAKNHGSAIAAIDVSCKSAARLIPILSAVLARYQERYISQHAVALQALKVERDRIVAEAQRRIASRAR